MGRRIDELADGYICYLEAQNDRFTARYNIDVEIYNLLHEFIELQYGTECENFYENYATLMGALEEVDPSLVAPRDPKPEGPLKLHVISSDKPDA